MKQFLTRGNIRRSCCIGLILVAIAVLAIRISTQDAGDRAPVDFSTLRKSTSPNQYLVCPPQLCAGTPDRNSPVYHIPARDLAVRVQNMVSQENRVHIINQNIEEMSYRYLQRSLIFGFPDIIDVQIFALSGDRSTLALYSHALVGHSDFGVNRRRIDAWLVAIERSINEQQVR